jgi:lipopolysaccharide biosynthesis glycosyltransferase
MINVFIGFDEGEKVSYHILSESIRRQSSVPVSITPLCLSNIPEFKRELQPNQSTEFAFSRFLVPYLSDYKGWSLFLDSDMMFRDDIKNLWDMIDKDKSIMCCKHDYIPKQNVKFRGAKNEPFPKKNWSSFMLMNNHRCKMLSKEYVETATGLELHQFKWTHEENVGELPLEWNWLVGEYDYNKNAKNVHWTLGGPYFKDYKNSEYADEWYRLYNDTIEVNL